MKVYIAGVIGCIIGYFVCALLSANERKALEDKLYRADHVISLAIKVIGYLGLWEDHEFDELSRAIDKHEED